MNEQLEILLQRYHCHSRKDYENALKEIIQEIALLGLWRAKFFEQAAFYGGTALRILYKLDRFSEDLDFSLLKTNKNFELSLYLSAIMTELAGFGLEAKIDSKIKTRQTAIQSAFIKANTKKQFINIKLPAKFSKNIANNDVLKIKLEIDTDPYKGFVTEVKTLLWPIPFSVHTFTLPDLFAGKLHALLCRQWQNRVKGRDWYDLVWYVARNIPARKKQLKSRLVQTKALSPTKKLDNVLLQQMLHAKIEKINFDQAKEDVLPFVKDPAVVALWSREFFYAIAAKIVLTD